MQELKVVLKKSENLSFGFSLLGTAGLPHVIYDICENSPAAECGEVEAGDVIVKVNGTDVHRFTTKEVLKCLRLSEDPVTLDLKRDPKIKARVRKYLAQSSNLHYSDLSDIELNTSITSSQKLSPIASAKPHGLCHRVTSSDPTCRPSRIPTIVKSPVHNTSRSCPQSPHGPKSKLPLIANGTGNNLIEEPSKQARFEAYIMTGDVIFNYSRTPPTPALVTSHSKKVDSLRDNPKRNTRQNGAVAPHAKGESSLSSPSFSDSSDSVSSIKKSIDKDHTSELISSRLLSEKDNLIKTDVESGGSTAGGDFSGDLTNDYSGCVSSSSSNSIMNKEPNTNNSDIVDCAKFSVDKDNKFNKSTKSGLIVQQNIISSSSSTSTVKSENLSSPDACFSVPTSPTSLTTPIIESLSLFKQKDLPNSVPTSPESGAQEIVLRRNQQQNGVSRRNDSAGFRTSRSEDHLQHTQRDILGAVVPIDIEEDVNSSLNTLLDTRHDSEDSQSSCDRDRIVWTYNAPIQPTTQSSNSHSHSHSSSISSSPQRSGSPASPTSVSSSIMSSSGSKGASHNNIGNTAAVALNNLMCPNGDQSISEAVSNISSPDYQDDDNLLSSKDMTGMAISDPSDSDSTILVSDAGYQQTRGDRDRDHKIVIKVKGFENQLNTQGYTELKDSEDELATITEDVATVVFGTDPRESSPPVSDDGSDVESLHSYHYSPKAVDIPSAVRLAKRLYGLDGFKKSDVSRHLSKNNDFSRVVADEYLKYFNFEKSTLDESLRQFLQQFSLSGETQERERVLVHFSRRYLDCNPGTYNSQDAVHTLTCAIMLLNTDLHGQNIGRKMTCAEFIDNLAELNDGENFPKDVLKYLYQAIKNHRLEWALDDDSPEQKSRTDGNSIQGPPVGPNPFLETPLNAAAIEYKKGYVMRKCCYDSNNKKTPFGKRSWKMFYCTLRDLVLYLHKDEHGFKKNQMSDNVHNAIRIHHALATKAADYKKKQHVFRLQTADQSEYLFQTSDSKELQSWIDTINFVCASFSAPPLEGGVGSQKRFQRPLLPSSHTKLLMRDQLATHEEKVSQLEANLADHKRAQVPNKGLPLQNHKEKEAYLQYELKRYKTYVYILSSRLLEDEQAEYQNALLAGNDETTCSYQQLSTGNVIVNNMPQQLNQTSNRCDLRETPS
ncbi:PH and SEC7 domain-containing protein-like isoform X4 [Bradysia coprophila]|uniref:PH and SEC7 domain-containing protein-like isoform X4 n=1 Tax=Bradysia coprophila TaxID=38358 RepID=UPI00187D8547|nr:PH and SEC7 domain-containing protein-like isoform X4 [Bradysia coprophila]